MSESSKTDKKSKKTVFLIDNNTGETEQLVSITSDHVLLHKSSMEAYKKKKELEEQQEKNKGKNWVAGYHEPIKQISHQLELHEAGAIMKLLLYLHFKQEGKLIKEGRPLNTTEMQNIFGRKRTQTSQILKKLVSLEILEKKKEGRSTVYYINSHFHTIGETIKKGTSFTKLYKAKATEVLEKVDLFEAGMLYKVLPYFHFQTYYLCANPDEEDLNALDHLTQEALADLIGHDVKTVSHYMSHLEDQGVLMIQKQSNTKRYLIHPDLMFRKEFEDEHTRVVRFQFEQLKKGRKR